MGIAKEPTYRNGLHYRARSHERHRHGQVLEGHAEKELIQGAHRPRCWQLHWWHQPEAVEGQVQEQAFQHLSKLFDIRSKHVAAILRTASMKQLGFGLEQVLDMI